MLIETKNKNPQKRRLFLLKKNISNSGIFSIVNSDDLRKTKGPQQKL